MGWIKEFGELGRFLQFMDQIEESGRLDANFLIHSKISYLNSEVTKCSNSFIFPKVTS